MIPGLHEQVRAAGGGSVGDDLAAGPAGWSYAWTCRDGELTVLTPEGTPHPPLDPAAVTREGGEPTEWQPDALTMRA